MYNGRKKIIIISIIVVLLVVLAGGIAFVYLATDLFKSNQTLFFKYVGQTFEDIKYVENTQLSEIENLKEEMPYTVVGNLNFEAGETNTDLNANVLDNISVNIESKANKPEEKTYSKINLLNNNQNLFTIEYANSNNIYALKSDEIVTAFLGIENENLKVLAQKLGITDTSTIPDSIEQIDINEVFAITEEEKAHISETYLPVLIQSINKENFTKENNLAVMKENITYNTTAYRLSLNSEELKQIEIALLQTLKQDSITLNLLTTKAKLLGLDEEYTQVNNLTKSIEEGINEIISEEVETDGGIDIIIYVDKQEVILSEIIFRNEIKYTIYGETQENTIKRNLLIENLSAESDYNKIEIEQIETRSNIESTNNILINMDDDMQINIDLINTGSATEKNLNTTCEINISQAELTSTISYEAEMNFEEEIDDIIELSRNNCGVLNDYTTEQLQALMQSVEQRTIEVLVQKMEILGINNIINSMFMYQAQAQVIEDAREGQQAYIEEMEQENQRLNEILSTMDNDL